MSMSDPIADMLNRIRNAQATSKPQVVMPHSGLRQAIAVVLKEEGYVGDVSRSENDGKPALVIQLKYFEGRPVIEQLKRVSTPGLRVYKGAGALPKVKGGLGVAIVTTSQGIMSDRAARKAGIGGEVVCFVV